MPIYEFRCEKCGEEFEKLVPRMGETAPCPKCGSDEVLRLFSSFAGITKGASPKSSKASSCGTSG